MQIVLMLLVDLHLSFRLHSIIKLITLQEKVSCSSSFANEVLFFLSFTVFVPIYQSQKSSKNHPIYCFAYQLDN